MLILGKRNGEEWTDVANSVDDIITVLYNEKEDAGSMDETFSADWIDESGAGLDITYDEIIERFGIPIEDWAVEHWVEVSAYILNESYPGDAERRRELVAEFLRIDPDDPGDASDDTMDKEMAFTDVYDYIFRSDIFRHTLSVDARDRFLKMFESYEVVPSGNYFQRVTAYLMFYAGFITGVVHSWSER